MKSPLLLAGFLMGAATAGWAATSPLYINYGPLTAPPALPPQIDATSFENRSLFNISSSTILGNTLPYETLNTLHFTNRSSGQMIGAPGFRFDFYTNNSRLMMADWINSGTIAVDTILSVSASNVVNNGPFISASANGVIKLSGKTVNLAHSALRTGVDNSTNLFFGCFFNTMIRLQLCEL